MSLVSYDFRYHNPIGKYLFSFDSYYGANYWVSERQVSSFTIDIPHTIGRKILPYLELDGIAEIYRTVGNKKTLMFNKRWLLGLWRDKVDDRGIKYLRLRFIDCNNLVDRRIVFYPRETKYTTINGLPADNAIKKLARENFGSLSTDKSRDWSHSIDIESNRSLCAPIDMTGFSYLKLMTVMNNICDVSYKKNGEYLTYDMSWQPEANKYVFKTYKNQLGSDRGARSEKPLYFTVSAKEETTDFGGLSYASVEVNGIDRRTVVYCGGGLEELTEEEKEEEVEAERVIVEVKDEDTIGKSPFGRWEDWEDARNSGNDLDGITAVAYERLEKWKPVVAVNGHMSDVFTRLIGKEFNWGDIIAFKFKNYIYDVHIDKVNFDLDENGDEDIQIFTRNMAETYY